MKKTGQLTLVPTPISRYYSLCSANFEILKTAFESNDLILVEDLKPSRQRWTSWGLPREAIETFVCYNEQNWKSSLEIALKEIKAGRNAVMFSDGGLPVIADPGRELVYQLRKSQVPIVSGQFDNSFLLALALSGFKNDQFQYLGFPPRDKEAREEFWKQVNKNVQTLIIMDTAYRLKRIQEELLQSGTNSQREIFFACDLNCESYQEYWGTLQGLKSAPLEGKQNFVLCLNSL